MVTHLAPTHVVATAMAALHTVTGQHMAATAEPPAANVLHTATAMVAHLVATARLMATATAQAVATALLTATGQHMAATAEPRAANVLHTATAMAQPAVAQLAAPPLAR